MSNLLFISSQCEGRREMTDGSPLRHAIPQSTFRAFCSSGRPIASFPAGFRDPSEPENASESHSSQLAWLGAHGGKTGPRKEKRKENGRKGLGVTIMRHWPRGVLHLRMRRGGRFRRGNIAEGSSRRGGGGGEGREQRKHSPPTIKRLGPLLRRCRGGVGDLTTPMGTVPDGRTGWGLAKPTKPKKAINRVSSAFVERGRAAATPLPTGSPAISRQGDTNMAATQRFTLNGVVPNHFGRRQQLTIANVLYEKREKGCDRLRDGQSG